MLLGNRASALSASICCRQKVTSQKTHRMAISSTTSGRQRANPRIGSTLNSTVAAMSWTLPSLNRCLRMVVVGNSSFSNFTFFRRLSMLDEATVTRTMSVSPAQP